MRLGSEARVRLVLDLWWDRGPRILGLIRDMRQDDRAYVLAILASQWIGRPESDRAGLLPAPVPGAVSVDR